MFAKTVRTYKRAIKRLCDLSQPQPKIGSLFKSMTPKQKALVRYCIWKLHNQGASKSQIVNHFKCSYNSYWNGVRWRKKQTANRLRKIWDGFASLQAKQEAERVQQKNDAEPNYSPVIGYRPQRHAFHNDCEHEFIEERKSKKWPVYDEYHGYDLDDFLIESTFK